jgi:hypothetical protein
MQKIMRNNEVVELTDEEFATQFVADPDSKPVAPTLDHRVAALEKALIDLALNNMEVPNDV